MKTLNILYVDESDLYANFAPIMARPFSMPKGSPVPIVVDGVTPTDGSMVPSLDDAYDMVAKEPDRWHIVVVDILFGPEPAPERLGAGLISRLRSSFPHLAVVAFTSGGSGAEEAALEAGAHAVVLKRGFAEDNGKRWLAKIREVLAQVGVHLSPFDPGEHIPPYALDGLTDLPLRAVVDQFGWQRLWEAVFEVNDRAPLTVEAVEFVAPGLSGAAVVRVVANVEVTPGDVVQRRLLVKASRVSGALEEEVQGRAKAMDLGGALFAAMRSEEVTIIEDWSFIAYELLEPAMTLRSWVKEAEGPRAAACAKELATRLRSANRSSARVIDKLAPYHSIRDGILPSYRRARVLLAIQDLEPLVEAFDLPVEFDAGRLRAVLGKNAVIDGVELSEGRISSVHVLSHGDLHGGNCLVDEFGRPTLVDPANVALRPWASDLARLHVDLAVSTLVTGFSVHDWTAVGGWKQLCTSPFDANEVSDGPRSTLAHLASACSELGAALAQKTGVTINVPFEVNLALACEYLRAAARKEELSVQGRLVALCAADHHVRLAVEAFTAAGER